MGRKTSLPPLEASWPAKLLTLLGTYSSIPSYAHSAPTGLKQTGLAHLELGRALQKNCNEKFAEYAKAHSLKKKELLKTLTSIHSAREKAYAQAKSVCR